VTVSVANLTWTVSVDADEPATYACSLDGEPWSPCGSTVAFPVKVGRHTLAAVATDQAGNVDATPATLEVKVTGKDK